MHCPRDGKLAEDIDDCERAEALICEDAMETEVHLGVLYIRIR